MPGKKYPQPVDTYLGLITPEGVVRSNKKMTLTDIEVWEYGFSKAISDLCPEGWKKLLGDEWEDILKLIICDWSPNSYLQITGLKAKEDFRCQFNSQAASLNRRIAKEHKIDVKDLAPLKGVYLVMIEKKKRYQKLTASSRNSLSAWKWRCEEAVFLVKSIYEYMKTVEDPRSPRAKKHEVAAVLTCLVAGYATGHITLRRCLGWGRRHEGWLKKNGLSLPNGIASLSTVSRLLSGLDEELFLLVFIEWIGASVSTKGGCTWQ